MSSLVATVPSAHQSRISKRITNVRRHTTGFVVGGRRVTRGQAVKMARRNKIMGVTAKHGVDGWYLSSLPNSEVNLYDLPVVVND